MKVIKRILIGLVVLVVAVVVLITVSSKGAIFNSGVPLGGITFSEEKVTNFPGLPGITVHHRRYIRHRSRRSSPGGQQQSPLEPLSHQRFRRYLVEWYKTETAEAGLGELKAREDPGAYIVAQGDTRYALYVVTLGETTNIIIASGKE